MSSQHSKSEVLVPLGSATVNQWQVSAGFADLTRRDGIRQTLEFAAEPQALRIDPGRTALMIIDMQNDFCHPKGWLRYIGVDIEPARRPIAPLQKLLPALRTLAVPVVWVNWGNRPDRLNLSPSLLHVYKPSGSGIGLGDPVPGTGAPVLEKGSWGAAIVDELQPMRADIHVDKYRMSGFWDTPLDSILRNLDISTLLFAGVNADQCVLCTLQDASCLGYDCIYLDDCAATTSPDYCRMATLYNIKQCFGFVAQSSDLVAAVAALN